MTFTKYHKIRQLGHEDNEYIFSNPEDEIVIEEKFDGANGRFYYDEKEDRIIFGSRTQSLGDNNTDIGGNWKRFVEFIKTKKSFKGGIIYFGEVMVKHTLDYDWEKIPPFIGFDIYDIKEQKYLDYETKKELFEQSDIPMVPLIKICKAKDLKKINEDMVPKSEYPSKTNEDTQAEGLVFKNYNKQLFAKIVREKFKEKNALAFGGSKKWAKNDSEVVVLTYCTNARIDKILFKLIDDGNKLDMTLMEHLPRRVIEDIYEEHWKEICMSNWSVDFKQIKRMIGKRCLQVLKQFLINNALEKADSQQTDATPIKG